jgi:hypothetical protein
MRIRVFRMSPVLGLAAAILLFQGCQPAAQQAPNGIQQDAKQQESSFGRKEPEVDSGLSLPQQNAIRSAKSYLDLKGFSREGLIDQLSSDYGDRYSVADATFAVDSLNIDWDSQAARAAKSYLELKGLSCDGLIQQLSSSYGDKFTESQAAFGAKASGVCG